MADGKPDGFYPRLNAELLKSGQFTGMIVSVVGVVQSFDGTTATLTCADKGMIQLTTELLDDSSLEPTTTVEIIGLAQNIDTVTIFVIRKLGPDLDLDIYNRMIVEVQQNPKFAQYFAPFTGMAH